MLKYPFCYDLDNCSSFKKKKGFRRRKLQYGRHDPKSFSGKLRGRRCFDVPVHEIRDFRVVVSIVQVVRKGIDARRIWSDVCNKVGASTSRFCGAAFVL